jgi:hypothetical protein
MSKSSCGVRYPQTNANTIDLYMCVPNELRRRVASEGYSLDLYEEDIYQQLRGNNKNSNENLDEYVDEEYVAHQYHKEMYTFFQDIWQNA